MPGTGSKPTIGAGATAHNPQWQGDRFADIASRFQGMYPSQFGQAGGMGAGPQMPPQMPGQMPPQMPPQANAGAGVGAGAQAGPNMAGWERHMPTLPDQASDRARQALANRGPGINPPAQVGGFPPTLPTQANDQAMQALQGILGNMRRQGQR
jgi:hypothetical protein